MERVKENLPVPRWIRGSSEELCTANNGQVLAWLENHIEQEICEDGTYTVFNVCQHNPQAVGRLSDVQELPGGNCKEQKVFRVGQEEQISSSLRLRGIRTKGGAVDKRGGNEKGGASGTNGGMDTEIKELGKS